MILVNSQCGIYIVESQWIHALQLLILSTELLYSLYLNLTYRVMIWGVALRRSSGRLVNQLLLRYLCKDVEYRLTYAFMTCCIDPRLPDCFCLRNRRKSLGSLGKRLPLGTRISISWANTHCL